MFLIRRDLLRKIPLIDFILRKSTVITETELYCSLFLNCYFYKPSCSYKFCSYKKIYAIC